MAQNQQNAYHLRTKFVVYTSLWLTPGFPGGVCGADPPASAGDIRDMRSVPVSGKALEESMAWQITQVFLPGEFDRQRSLA